MVPQSRPARAADEKYDREFLNRAVEWTIGEVELARLAKEQAENKAVRNYAELQYDGYRKLLDDFREMARDMRVKVTDELGPKQRDTGDHLVKIRGHDFDAWFMKDQCDEQKALLELFEKGSKNANDSKLRDKCARLVRDVGKRYDDAVQLY